MKSKGKGKGIMAPLELSDRLADFIGKSEETRGGVMKALWKHIKKKGLQDKNDKRVINPDKVLAPIIGKKPINMFKMAKKLAPHFVG